MSATQKISCVLWFLGFGAVVAALFSSDWMGGIGLRGVSGHPWSELEAHLGAAASERVETAALFGPIVFWGGLAVAVAMLPAAWYFRYGKTIGRLWVGIGTVAIGLAGIGFCFSMSEPKLHYPAAVFFIGIVLALAGSLAGFAEPKPDPRSKPLEF